MSYQQTIISQYLHEYTTWLRELDFYKQENSYLKARLAEVLEHKDSRDFLPHAEHFQNQFIIKDDQLDRLMHEARILEQEYQNLEKKGATADELFEIKHKRLQNEMEYFEKEFARLKNEFNQFLLNLLK